MTHDSTYFSCHFVDALVQGFCHESDDGENDEAGEDGGSGGDARDEISVTQNVTAKGLVRGQSENATPTARQGEGHLGKGGRELCRRLAELE